MIGKPSAADVTARATPWLASYPAGVAYDQRFIPSTVTDLFDKAVKQHADRPAMTFAGRTTTYKELAAQVAAAAAVLSANGVTAGTRVGLLLPNAPTYIIYFYAALRCGAVVVNYNTMQAHEDLRRQVHDSGTTLMVTLDLKILFDKVESLLAEGMLERAVVASFTALLTPAKAVAFRLFKSKDLAQPARSAVAAKLVLEPLLVPKTPSDRSSLAPRRPSDLAVLQYTGGVTGTPKGAMLSHANLTVNVAQLTAWSASVVTPGQERILAVLPLFHVFAMTTIVLYGIALGAEIVIQPRFQLDETLDLIVRSRPTMMPGVPTLFAAIANYERAATVNLKSLKLCLCGGAGLPPDVARAFRDVTGATLVEAYGLSETSPGVTCNPLDGRARDGSIGLPLPGTRIVISDPDRPEREMPFGQPGEIRVSGPQVTSGYWDRPDDTAAAFVSASLRTGDIGYMDPDGFIYIVDRIKDVIISSGFKIYPRQIEDKLYQHPAVEEVTVIGIPDARRGEAPKAFVKLKPGASATAADLAAHLEARLSKIERPTEIDIRGSLPKTVIGKLSKQELIAEEAAKRSAEGLSPL